MEAADRMIMFNSTILVFWAVLLVPLIFKSRKYWLLVVSGCVLIPIEISLYRDLQEFPGYLLSAVLAYFLSLTGGFVMYHFNHKQVENLSDAGTNKK